MSTGWYFENPRVDTLGSPRDIADAAANVTQLEKLSSPAFRYATVGPPLQTGYDEDSNFIVYSESVACDIFFRIWKR